MSFKQTFYHGTEQCFVTGVVTHDGLMYVVGGDDGTSNLSSVEMYNPKTDTWTLLKAAMGIGRSYTGVCVIEKPESF